MRCKDELQPQCIPTTPYSTTAPCTSLSPNPSPLLSERLHWRSLVSCAGNRSSAVFYVVLPTPFFEDAPQIYCIKFIKVRRFMGIQPPQFLLKPRPLPHANTRRRHMSAKGGGALYCGLIL